MRKFWLILSACLVLAAALAVPAAASAGKTFPEVIPLPKGWGTEGIAVGRGTTFFAGSIPTGSIYRGDLQTGEGGVLASFGPSDGRSALGVYLDPRTNHLFVAGGLTGHAYVYDGDTGATLANYVLPGAGLINDVVVTDFAAYFTDSFNAQFFKVPLGPGGALLPSPVIQTIGLTGDFVQDPNVTFNSNGIEVTPGGHWLIIVNSAPGKLYRVDPQTGYATAITLGGGGLAPSVPDGLRFVGNTLYVVENFKNRVAVVRFDPGFTSGTVVEGGYITDRRLQIPTTIGKFGNSLYAVNAKFDIAPPPGPYPDVPFEVVRLPRN